MGWKVKAIEVEVDHTARDWQLYCDEDADQVELDAAAKDLNKAAAAAIATMDHEKAWALFAKTQAKWASVGAFDTEPAWEFEKMLTGILGPDEDEK